MPPSPDEVPPWDRGPRCPARNVEMGTACGGPAVPAAEHHLASKFGIPPGHRLACARCFHTWRGEDAEVAAADAAHDAWARQHRESWSPWAPGMLSRSQWEERKATQEREKLERLREGRW